MTSHGRVLPYVGAAGWAVVAVMFGLGIPQAGKRMPVKLTRLRREIGAHYPDDWS